MTCQFKLSLQSNVLPIMGIVRHIAHSFSFSVLYARQKKSQQNIALKLQFEMESHSLLCFIIQKESSY